MRRKTRVIRFGAAIEVTRDVVRPVKLLNMVKMLMTEPLMRKKKLFLRIGEVDVGRVKNISGGETGCVNSRMRTWARMAGFVRSDHHRDIGSGIGVALDGRVIVCNTKPGVGGIAAVRVARGWKFVVPSIVLW